VGAGESEGLVWRVPRGYLLRAGVTVALDSDIAHSFVRVQAGADASTSAPADLSMNLQLRNSQGFWHSSEILFNTPRPRIGSHSTATISLARNRNASAMIFEAELASVEEILAA
jgi:hypothetical protein